MGVEETAGARCDAVARVVASFPVARDVPDGVVTTVDEPGTAVRVLPQAASTKTHPAESSANLRNDLTMAAKVARPRQGNGRHLRTKPPRYDRDSRKLGEHWEVGCAWPYSSEVQQQRHTTIGNCEVSPRPGPEAFTSSAPAI